MLHRARRAGLLALAAVAGWSLASPGEAAIRFPYEPGDRIVIQGTVTDAAGKPVPDIEVVLEASRIGFGWRGQQKRQTVRGASLTGANGEFGLELRWSQRFNHFELQVGVPLKVAGGTKVHELRQIDITRRLQHGTPVTVPVILDDTKFVENLRLFVASVDSADERRVYDQMGHPDRVDNVLHGDGTETAWWYFRAGTVYRFENGALVKTEEFDPVEPL